MDDPQREMGAQKMTNWTQERLIVDELVSKGRIANAKEYLLDASENANSWDEFKELSGMIFVLSLMEQWGYSRRE